MILVADSGATKCDWMYADGDKISDKVSTMGFSPFFHTEELIIEKIREKEHLASVADKMSKVFYYGTGCSSTDRKQKIQKALQKVFVNAKVEVDHDLNGAAVATCMGEPGIACILGTGSNSCYYDGKDVFEEVPSLGHRLGDEGSGYHFGKQLLRLFLYKRLPDYLMDKLSNDYGLDKEKIFANVYKEGYVNTYLASFMKSVSDFNNEKWVKEFIYKGLSEFADFHIKVYKNYDLLPVNFVGSIAYYFKHVLEDVAKDNGFEIGRVIKQPINNLVEFHRK